MIICVAQYKNKEKIMKNELNALKGVSIRTKIIVALISLSLISLISISSIVGYQIHKELKIQSKQQLLSTVRQKSTEYNLMFDRLAKEAEAIASSASKLLQRDENLVKLDHHKVLMPWLNQGTGVGKNKGYGSPKLNLELANKIPKIQRVGEMLIGIASKNKLIADAYFATFDDIFVGDNNKQILNLSKRNGYIPSNRDWYKKAKKEGRTIWTAPYVGASQGRLMVTVATPVYGINNKFLGVVGFDVLLQKIKKDVLSINTGYGGYSLLISTDGKALAAPDIEKGIKNWDSKYHTENLLSTSNFKWNEIAKKMVSNKYGIDEYDDNGIRYVAYSPVTAINASVGLVVLEADVIKPAVEILIWIAVAATIISIIALIIGIMLGNSISNPILQLTHLINDISSGKSKLETIKIDRSDELSLLADAFNRLTKSLKIALAMNKKT